MVAAVPRRRRLRRRSLFAYVPGVREGRFLGRVEAAEAARLPSLADLQCKPVTVWTVAMDALEAAGVARRHQLQPLSRCRGPRCFADFNGHRDTHLGDADSHLIIIAAGRIAVGVIARVRQLYQRCSRYDSAPMGCVGRAIGHLGHDSHSYA